MGTETLIYFFQICDISYLVKLNNPLMGTETWYLKDTDKYKTVCMLN